MPDDPIKDALNMMPYGFYAVTSRSGDEVNAMVANWIIQASFEPRLVVMALQKTSYTHGLVENGGVVTINIFRQGDEESMMPFTKGRANKPDKMKEAKYMKAPETGCPVIDGAAAYIELEVQDLIDIGGDHDILVGRPVGAKVLKPAEPNEVLTLPYIGWSYSG